MKLSAIIKDKKIIDTLDFEDGIYDIEIKQKGDSRTLEQIKKLWATIDDISRAEYGDTSQSKSIYLQILNMSGVQTSKLLMKEEALDLFKKKVRAYEIVSKEVVNHIPYVNVNCCFVGISEMSKREVANVIESAIRYASEVGVETEL